VYKIAVLHRPDRISFSACLARALTERRLTSSELIARLPHLHFVPVYRLLSGAIPHPSISTVADVCRAFGVDPERRSIRSWRRCCDGPTASPRRSAG